jgi:transcriptional regulator with XRE-family HTH domain
MEAYKYNKDYGKHFGRNLHKLRKARKLTLRGMEARCGLSHQTLFRYEHGDLPSMLCALILADFFGVTLDELIKPKVPTA